MIYNHYITQYNIPIKENIIFIATLLKQNTKPFYNFASGVVWAENSNKPKIKEKIYQNVCTIHFLNYLNDFLESLQQSANKKQYINSIIQLRLRLAVQLLFFSPTSKYNKMPKFSNTTLLFSYDLNHQS